MDDGGREEREREREREREKERERDLLGFKLCFVNLIWYGVDWFFQWSVTAFGACDIMVCRWNRTEARLIIRSLVASAIL